MKPRLFGSHLDLRRDVLLWSMGRAGQGFVPRVDPGLSGLDSAGDQEDGVLSRIVLPVGGYALTQHKRIITKAQWGTLKNQGVDLLKSKRADIKTFRGFKKSNIWLEEFHRTGLFFPQGTFWGFLLQIRHQPRTNIFFLVLKFDWLLPPLPGWHCILKN